MRNLSADKRDLITNEEKKQFKKLFKEGVTYPEITKRLGRHIATWQKVRRKLNLPFRERGKGKHINPKDNPGLDPPIKHTLLWRKINTSEWNKQFLD